MGYAVLGLTMANILHTWPGASIESRVRHGLIGIDLTRPLGLLGQNLAVQTGFVIAVLPAAGSESSSGCSSVLCDHPSTSRQASAFAVSLVLAFAVAQLITLLMSLSSFWTLEVGGLEMTFSVVRMFLSGAVVPLWFMPGWLQGVAAVLPVPGLHLHTVGDLLRQTTWRAGCRAADPARLDRRLERAVRPGLVSGAAPGRGARWLRWRKVSRRRPPSMLRQYRVLLRLGIASATQYRLDFVLTAFGAVCYEAVSLAFVGVVVSAFGTIGGWTFTEIAFIYGIRTMGHALHSAVTGQLWATDHVIRDGEFDRYLLRPVDPLVQLLTRRFQVTAVGDIAFGVAVVIITALTAPIDWSPWKIGYLVAAVLGSAFAESAVMLGIAGLSFRLLSVNPLLSAADMIFVTFGPYPLSVLPRAVAWILDAGHPTRLHRLLSRRDPARPHRRPVCADLAGRSIPTGGPAALARLDPVLPSPDPALRQPGPLSRATRTASSVS